MASEEPAKTVDHRRFRTRIANGKTLVANVDQRSHAARRHREIYQAIIAELDDSASEAERLIALNASAWQVHAEELTSRMVRGEDIDPEALSRAVSGASRLVTRLLRSRPRKPTASGPSLNERLLAGRSE